MTDTPPFLEIADSFADPVGPADFPKAIVRFRNQRWAGEVGLGSLSDAEWAKTYSEFPALAGNLPQPLAMRYHGHQFGVYNPELGDGRGFLYAQVRGTDGKLYDLGTKGSGQTPWSRSGDGRLTLKGGVREVLAATYLEALGVKTSKLFSLVETGEALQRNDEPSPTRSAVMVRLSETHIRIGTFQRVMVLGKTDELVRLVKHVVHNYHPQADHEDMSKTCVALAEAVAQDVGRMIGQWMAAGFVHGVMNTDNFNLTGETFDFGPYRFLPQSDPNFVAAYFDHQGLYRFGRQPAQGLWVLQQFAAALSPLANTDDLGEALKTYELAYQESFRDHSFALLGVMRGELGEDLPQLGTFYGWMTNSGAPWHQVFFDWFGGPASEARAASSPAADFYKREDFAPVRDILMAREPDRPDRLDKEYFAQSRPCTLLYDEIEALWARIAEDDDWSAFEAKLSDLENLRLAYGLDGPKDYPS
ncbi:MAG: YdiU family protein [Pseudomonadota bacterium]